MMFFKNLCVIVLWTKGASALGGLKYKMLPLCVGSKQLFMSIKGDWIERYQNPIGSAIANYQQAGKRITSRQRIKTEHHRHQELANE